MYMWIKLCVLQLNRVFTDERLFPSRKMIVLFIHLIYLFMFFFGAKLSQKNCIKFRGEMNFRAEHTSERDL